MIQWFLKGGPTMWPLLLCSIVTLAIMIERWLFLRRAKIDIAGFIGRINTLLGENKIQEAMRLCEVEKSPIATMFRAGLKKYRKGKEEVEKAVLSAGNLEVAKMERGLVVLNTMNKLAPLLGFFGTVTGMSNAFTAASLAGLGDPKVVAGGIAEALITTIAGLAIAMPGTFAYYLFLSRINRTIYDMQEYSVNFVDALEELEEKVAQRSAQREIVGGEFLEI